MSSKFDAPKQFKSWKYRCAEMTDRDACTAQDKCSYSDMHQVCIPKKIAFAQSTVGSLGGIKYEAPAIRQAVDQARAHVVRSALDKKCFEATTASSCGGNCEYNFWENECLPRHIADRITLTSKLFRKSDVVKDYLKRHRAVRSVKNMQDLSRFGMGSKLVGVAGITAIIANQGLSGLVNVGRSAITNKFMQDSVKNMMHVTTSSLHSVLSRLTRLGMQNQQVVVCTALITATLSVLRHRKTTDDLTKQQVKENRAWQAMDASERRVFVVRKLREERDHGGPFTTRFKGLSTDDVNGPLHVASGIHTSGGIVESIWKATFGRGSKGLTAMNALKERQVKRYRELRVLKDKMRRLDQSDARQREQYGVLHKKLEQLRKDIYRDRLFVGEELLKVVLIASVVAGCFYMTYTRQTSWAGIAFMVGVVAVLLYKVLDYLYGPTEAKSLVRFLGNSVRTVGRIIRAVFKAVKDLFMGDEAGTY